MLESIGIEVGGAKRHDIQVLDSSFFARVLRDGALGFGESYVDGDWESSALDETLTRLARADLNTFMGNRWHAIPRTLKARLRKMQSKARYVGGHHCEVRNGLFASMLDEKMIYSCADWRDSEDLDAAQEAKLDLVCRKIGLREGMSVLDLGCGWGSFAKYAAERYGARVKGVTVSKQQVELARYRCAGLPVEILLQDDRTVVGTYDAVISLGSLEYVGSKNYRRHVDLAESCVAPDGIALVHAIGGSRSWKTPAPWNHKYMFPKAALPTVTQLGRAIEGNFVLEDVHNVGPDYDRTLMAWDENVRRAWPDLKAGYGDRFYRMWRYYLCMRAAGFRTRQLQLYELVLTRKGPPRTRVRGAGGISPDSDNGHAPHGFRTTRGARLDTTWRAPAWEKVIR
jgi:cyclopropane-fatty-acyl-phospholipid synthase